jgi:hypothetical protein
MTFMSSRFNCDPYSEKTGRKCADGEEFVIHKLPLSDGHEARSPARDGLVKAGYSNAALRFGMAPGAVRERRCGLDDATPRRDPRLLPQHGGGGAARRPIRGCCTARRAIWTSPEHVYFAGRPRR